MDTAELLKAKLQDAFPSSHDLEVTYDPKWGHYLARGTVVISIRAHAPADIDSLWIDDQIYQLKSQILQLLGLIPSPIEYRTFRTPHA